MEERGNMIKTTVVIPNYNGMKYIENCLLSLMKQSISEYRIIVVDNGSTDGSRELVKEKFPMVDVISLKENTGFCKAVNVGIQASDSKYVLLLNNDTTVEKDFLEQMEKGMERSEKIFSASAKMVVMDNPEVIDGAGDLYCALGWAYARGKGKTANACRVSKKIFASCGGAAIYRRAVFEQIGYFDENHFAYLEDMDIGYRAKIHGYRNIYLPKAVVKHAGSAVSGSRYNEFKIRLSSRNSIYLIYKNMPFLQILINLPFLFAGFLIKTLFFTKKGFGMVYLKGLGNGIASCFRTEIRQKKVKFQVVNLGNYIKIQWELWVNIIRRFYDGI